ncbi:MAG: FHA domain-containing protein [Prolixibacteraceae bacterium]|jgi:hypothetical protein
MIKQITIGRGDECMIRMTDPSQRVSRSHATLKVYENGKIFITDHSSNGTWVNGVKISQNVEFPVKRGDSINFAHAAELNWEQIPKTKNKAVFYVLVALVLIGLAAGGYYLFSQMNGKDEVKKEEVKPQDDEAMKKRVQREKAVKDSIRKADSLRISQKAIRKLQEKEKKKTEPEKKTEVKPSTKDSTKKELPKVIL